MQVRDTSSKRFKKKADVLVQELEVCFQDLVFLHLLVLPFSVGFLVNLIPLCLGSSTLSSYHPSNPSEKNKNLVFQHFQQNSWTYWRWMTWFWSNFHPQPWRRHGWRKSSCLRKTFVLFPQREEWIQWQAGKNNRRPSRPSSYAVGSHVDKGISF